MKETQTLETFSPELTPPPVEAETIAAAFENPQTILYGIIRDPDFHVACTKDKIDPNFGMDTPAYWNKFADYADERLTALSGRENGLDPLQFNALQLVTKTPAFLMAQSALNHRKYPRNSEEHAEATKMVNGYKSQIHEFVADYPETKFSTLKGALANVANFAVEDEDLSEISEKLIHNKLREVRHELAYKQILDATGRSSRHARKAEAAQGIDIVVDNNTSAPLKVDVTPSTTQIERGGHPDATFLKLSGDSILAHSLTQDSEFMDDRFFTPAQVAEDKVEQLNADLALARSRAA